MAVNRPIPKGFIPALQIEAAKLHPNRPWFIKERRVRGSRARGVSYEKKALSYLEYTSPLPLLPGPWIEFTDSGKTRWCQPDGLLIDPWEGRLIIVEVKYQHTERAWWQLRRLYGPLAKRLFPDYSICLVELCRWYDPAVYFPESVHLLSDYTQASPTFLGVHIWKP